MRKKFIIISALSVLLMGSNANAFFFLLSLAQAAATAASNHAGGTYSQNTPAAQFQNGTMALKNTALRKLRLKLRFNIQ